jgi:hypothetical protein
MMNTSDAPAWRFADNAYTRLITSIDELCDFVRPLVGQRLTDDEEDEIQDLSTAFVLALQKSELSQPPIPEPNEDGLPEKHRWSPYGLADLYMGPNRDEVKEEDGEWLFYTRLQVPAGWFESFERLRRIAVRKAGAAEVEAAEPKPSPDRPAPSVPPNEPNAVADATPEPHPLERLYAEADRIIGTAGIAYRWKSMDRNYWDAFGSNPNVRQKHVLDHFRALGDAALKRISADDLWGKLTTNTSDLNALTHEIAWHLGQAAGVQFPPEAEGPGSDDRFAEAVERLTSQCWVYLQRLRPFVTCLSALHRPSDHEAAAVIKELEAREASVKERNELSERADELRAQRELTNKQLDQLAVFELFRHRSSDGPVVDPPLSTWAQVFSLLVEIVKFSDAIGDLDAWKNADRDELKAVFIRGTNDPTAVLQSFETGCWLYDRAVERKLTAEILQRVWKTGGAGRAAVGKLFELVRKTVLGTLPPKLAPSDGPLIGLRAVPKKESEVVERPDPAEHDKNGAESEHDLSERQESILAAMYQLGAFGQNSRRTGDKIANEVQRNLKGSSIAADCAVLKTLGYVDSQEGGGGKGGRWLTNKGIERAKRFLSPSDGKDS